MKWLEKASEDHLLKVYTQGSAIKYCHIAEGLADLYVKKGRIYEWDTAAGQLILEESGGGIIHFGSGRAPVYNKANPEILDFLAYGNRISNPGNWLF